MGLRVKTNIDSLVAQRRLGETRRQLGDQLEKLSSGQRINKSADDAAGLAVSESIRARVSSLGVAKRNASDGVSYIQVAEGGLNEVTNIVIRMRELATQAASDTLGNLERGFLDKEFNQLRQEAGRIMKSTEFNGTKLLTSTDANGDPRKPIQMFVGASFRGTPPGQTDLPQFDVESDPDILQIDLTKLEGLTDMQTNLDDKQFTILGGAEKLSEVADGFGASSLYNGSEGGTAQMLGKLDNMLSVVAEFRSTLGAVQSRLNSTITNIEISNENLSAAQSRIRDVDFAAETAKFTQTQILSSAGISVLAQANQVPEAVLQLLR